MYHYNYTNNWIEREGGISATCWIGPTKYDSIFIPFIGNMEKEDEETLQAVGSPANRIPFQLLTNSFRIINSRSGIALIDEEDFTERIFYTGYETAGNKSSLQIIGDHTTCAVLEQAYAQGNAEAKLAYVALFDIGQQLVILELSDNRPPWYTVYTNKGMTCKGESYAYPLLTIDVMDGAEWIARLSAKELQESPEAYTYI